MSNRGRKKGVPAARQAGKGRNPIVMKKLRYAIIEMGSYHDVGVFEKHLRKSSNQKTLNVSPKNGKGITFSKRHAAKWPGYKIAIEASNYSDGLADEPSWWYISGHHAPFGDGHYYAQKEEYGFFNEVYYEAYDASRSVGILSGKIKDAIFMTTSRKDFVIALIPDQKNPNPFYIKPVSSNCKGLFLIGCNTLSSPDVRKLLSQYFPNAVVFGYYLAKAPGGKSKQENNIKGIFSVVEKARPSFFEDPEKYFNIQGGVQDALKAIVGKLSGKTGKRRLAVLYKKVLYVPEYLWDFSCWFHQFGFEQFLREMKALSAGETLLLCPVPQKKNPFLYSPDRKYIIGVTGHGDDKVYVYWKYSDFSGLKGFTRLNTLLVMVLGYLQGKVGESITVNKISSDGDRVEIYSPKNIELKDAAQNLRNRGSSVKIKEISPNNFSVETP